MAQVEWSPSPMVARILRQPGICWSPTSHAFKADMLRLQGDLIRCHWEGMDEETKTRAAATLHWLEQQLSGDAS